MKARQERSGSAEHEPLDARGRQQMQGRHAVISHRPSITSKDRGAVMTEASQDRRTSDGRYTDPPPILANRSRRSSYTLPGGGGAAPVSYTHLRAHETRH